MPKKFGMSGDEYNLTQKLREVSVLVPIQPEVVQRAIDTVEYYAKSREDAERILAQLGIAVMLEAPPTITTASSWFNFNDYVEK